MWQIFLVLYLTFTTANYLLRRELAQKLGTQLKQLNAIFFLLFLLPTAIILSFFFQPDFNPGTLNLVLLFAGSIIWPLLSLISIYANKYVDAGIFSIISNLSPISTLLIALPFLNENLNGLQFSGVGLLVLSGIIATAAQVKKHSKASLHGILLCLLAAMILGIAVVYESYMLKRVGFGTYLVYGWGSQIVWATLMAGSGLKQIPLMLQKKETGKTILFWGGTKALASIGFISALYLSGSASIFSAATDFLSVAVVIAAYFYLKERENMFQKVLGAGIGIAGLLLIAK